MKNGGDVYTADSLDWRKSGSGLSSIAYNGYMKAAPLFSQLTKTSPKGANFVFFFSESTFTMTLKLLSFLNIISLKTSPLKRVFRGLLCPLEGCWYNSLLWTVITWICDFYIHVIVTAQLIQLILLFLKCEYWHFK